MKNIKESNKADFAFQLDCQEEGISILKDEEVLNESFDEPISSLSIVKQYQRDNRGIQPVFH